MEENGFYISENYKKVMRNIGKIGINKIDKENYEDIFSNIGEVSEEEKNFLDGLHTSISMLTDLQMHLENAHIEPITKFLNYAIFDSVARSKERIRTNELDS